MSARGQRDRTRSRHAHHGHDGQTISSAGGSVLYQINGGVTTTEPKQIRVTMKCLQVQGSSVYPSGQGGTFFGFATGSVQYGFSITPTQVYMLTSSGFVLTASGLDNSSAFHDYVFDWTSATSFRIYRDGVLAGTASAGSALAANRLLFGDGTGGANAQVHIRALRFIQDLPTAAPTTTWGRVKRLYKALKTADAGYLTRRLVDVSQDIIICEDDCGTLRGLVASALKKNEEIVESLYDRVLGRTSVHDVVHPLTGKVIMRSQRTNY